MTLEVIDIHPHIISPDPARYPTAPLRGQQSDWSKERPQTFEQLVAEMDAAGVGQGGDRAGLDLLRLRQLLRGRQHRHRPEALHRRLHDQRVRCPTPSRCWRAGCERGFSGLRIFTGGATHATDESVLDDPRSFPVWEYAGDRDLPIAVQTGPVGLPKVARAAAAVPAHPAGARSHRAVRSSTTARPTTTPALAVRAGGVPQPLPEADAAQLRAGEDRQVDARGVLRRTGQGLRRRPHRLRLQPAGERGAHDAHWSPRRRPGLASLSPADQAMILRGHRQAPLPVCWPDRPAMSRDLPTATPPLPGRSGRRVRGAAGGSPRRRLARGSSRRASPCGWPATRPPRTPRCSS